MAKWKLVDSRTDASLFPLFLYESGAGENSPMHKALGVSLKGIMIAFHGDRWDFCEVSGDWKRVSQRVLARLEREPNFVEKAVKETYKLGNKMLEFTENVNNTNLAKKTNREVGEYYREYCNRNKAMRGYAWIAPALDLSGFLTRKLGVILERKIKDPKKRAEAFTILTNPSKQTLGKQQDKDLLRIAAKANENEKTRALFQKDLKEIMASLPEWLDWLFEEHTKRYCWLPCTYESPAWDKKYFVSVVASIVKQGADPKKELEKIVAKEEENEEKKNELFAQLKLTPQEKHLFEVAQEIIFFKADRKDVLFKSYYEMRPLIKEIAKRLHITPKQTRYLLPNELEKALKTCKADVELLNDRRKFSVAIMENNSTRVLVGREAKEALKYLEKEEVKDVKELKGQCANPGKAKGIVKLILSPKDMKKMNESDIMVSNATDPNVVPAMKNAAAIITNTGGITCHAAIVSRELGKPCVIGTKVATEVLKDGDLVEVDATAGIVRKVKK